METDYVWWQYVLLLVGGVLAGIINTLAGNGSSITLSILLGMGMPATVANATNRIGASLQVIVAVLSLKRTLRTRILFKDTLWYVLPALLGSIIGAFLAVDIDPELLKRIIGAIMLLLLLTLVLNPQKWSRPTDLLVNKKTPLNWAMIFLSAAYAGFIQMGMGILILAVLVLIAHYSLRDGNIIKLALSLVLVIPPFLVFLFIGELLWIPGLVLAVGQSVGAVIGARYILFLPNANTYVRWLLVVILIISSYVLLGVHDFLIQLLGL